MQTNAMEIQNWAINYCILNGGAALVQICM